uniref:PPR32 phosphatase n=1 Tax=Strix occidentalis caurina TaxID=311401 RepID=A0A8D0KQ17_STROC
MASARPFVCPRAEPRALAQDSPAAGLGAVSPLAKACADLMNFYAMTYAVAHGRESRRPPRKLGGGGYVSNNHPTISCLLCPRSADTATSTTAEHFKPFWLPDGRSLLPWHIQQSGSRYPHGSSLPFLCTGAVSPRHTRLPQGSPKASRKHSTRRGLPPALPAPHRCPAEDDHQHQGAVRFHQSHPKERPCPASPASPAHEPPPHRIPCPPPAPCPSCTPREPFSLPQLGLSITTTDFLPSACSHGSETLPAGSERGSGFSREARRCLGTAVSRIPPRCPFPCTLPGLTRCPHADLACRGPPRCSRLPRTAGTPSDPGWPAGTTGCWQEGGCSHGPGPSPAGPRTQPLSIPQELSGFTKNHGQYVTPARPCPVQHQVSLG